MNQQHHKYYLNTKSHEKITSHIYNLLIALPSSKLYDMIKILYLSQYKKPWKCVNFQDKHECTLLITYMNIDLLLCKFCKFLLLKLWLFQKNASSHKTLIVEHNFDLQVWHVFARIVTQLPSHFKLSTSIFV